MGVKKSVIPSGMQTNALKQCINGFNGLKSKNTDFQNVPLYFLKFPLYNVMELCYSHMEFQTSFLDLGVTMTTPNVHSNFDRFDIYGQILANYYHFFYCFCQ